MKKQMIRFFSIALLLMLVISTVLPEARALERSSYQDISNGVISGKWGDEKFWRNRRYTYPYEFDRTLNSCTGFTLDYEIVEVNKGNFNSGKFKMEVYVRNTKGSWKSVGSFYLDGLLTTTEFTFDPISIDAVAVVCQMQGSYDYVQDVTVRNAVYRSTTEKAEDDKTGSDNQTVRKSTGKPLSGTWLEKRLIRNGHSTYPFAFDSPLNRCTGFTVNYEITEITKGNLDGNFKYAVYIRTTGGKWKYAKEFKMDGLSASKKITFDAPISIDAVAVMCMKKADVTYSYDFTITDPITK